MQHLMCSKPQRCADRAHTSPAAALWQTKPTTLQLRQRSQATTFRSESDQSALALPTNDCSWQATDHIGLAVSGCVDLRALASTVIAVMVLLQLPPGSTLVSYPLALPQLVV